MITTVTGKHQVTVPAKLVQELGIGPGSRLRWESTGNPGEICVRILPSRRSVANSLLGAGRRLAKANPA
ncbi:MAG: AbrB/MazE/SpoVT family DNA-binding domain-containing protein [Opitutaceae bacterium]|nr:AbrB/MazE/SpoVT family DNA-binding domain-containing protein [Opitutaceae bacterium]